MGTSTVTRVEWHTAFWDGSIINCPYDNNTSGKASTHTVYHLRSRCSIQSTSDNISDKYFYTFKKGKTALKKSYVFMLWRIVQFHSGVNPFWIIFFNILNLFFPNRFFFFMGDFFFSNRLPSVLPDSGVLAFPSLAFLASILATFAFLGPVGKSFWPLAWPSAGFLGPVPLVWPLGGTTLALPGVFLPTSFLVDGFLSGLPVTAVASEVSVSPSSAWKRRTNMSF